MTIERFRKNIILLKKAYLEDFMITIHGTKTKPVEYERFIEADTSLNVSYLSSYESYQFKISTSINMSSQIAKNKIILYLITCNFIFLNYITNILI